jgi:1-acyl-sn-glycerol-3-phosphate acyltransferase
MAPFKAIIHTVWNWINAPLRLAFRLYFAGVFFLVLLLTYPIFKLLIKRGERYTAVFALFKKVSLVIQWLGLVPVKIVKKEHFPDPPFIAIANHASYLDIVHMYSVIPNYFLFLGKSELLHWPIIRIFFKGMNIPVDRKNYKRSMQALMDASDRLKEGKKHCIVS